LVETIGITKVEQHPKVLELLGVRTKDLEFESRLVNFSLIFFIAYM